MSLSDLPAITASQMREIDRLAVDEFGVDVVQMVELAGLNLAQFAAALLGGIDGRRITLLVGPNGHEKDTLWPPQRVNSCGD